MIATVAIGSLFYLMFLFIGIDTLRESWSARYRSLGIPWRVVGTLMFVLLAFGPPLVIASIIGCLP